MGPCLTLNTSFFVENIVFCHNSVGKPWAHIKYTSFIEAY